MTRLSMSRPEVIGAEGVFRAGVQEFVLSGDQAHRRVRRDHRGEDGDEYEGEHDWSDRPCRAGCRE